MRGGRVVRDLWLVASTASIVVFAEDGQDLFCQVFKLTATDGLRVASRRQKLKPPIIDGEEVSKNAEHGGSLIA